MELVRFLTDDAALQRLLDSPAGPVGRDLERRAKSVESKARDNASGGTGPNVRTDSLRLSIRHVIGVDGKGLFADIGSDKPHSVYMERGTRPHRIVSHGDYLLRSAPGHPDPLIIPRHAVNHPGNPAYPFLKPALEAFD